MSADIAVRDIATQTQPFPSTAYLMDRCERCGHKWHEKFCFACGRRYIKATASGVTISYPECPCPSSLTSPRTFAFNTPTEK